MERRELANKTLRRLITAGQLMALELRRLGGEIPDQVPRLPPTEGLADAWDESLTTWRDEQLELRNMIRPAAAGARPGRGT